MGRHYTYIFKTPYMPGQGIDPFLYSTYRGPSDEGYAPMENNIFISCDSTPEVAYTAMERLAARQFQMICRSEKLRTGLQDRTAIKINVAAMLDVWGRQRKDRQCMGVYFWINSGDMEIYGDAFYWNGWIFCTVYMKIWLRIDINDVFVIGFVFVEPVDWQIVIHVSHSERRWETSKERSHLDSWRVLRCFLSGIRKQRRIDRVATPSLNPIKKRPFRLIVP